MSSATFHADARHACRARMMLVTSLPAERAWEGFTYDPTIGTPFVEDAVAGLGDTPRGHGAIEHRIGYIITLKYPSNRGTADIEAMAGALLDQFKVGTALNYGSTSVLCMSAERRGQILKEPNWLVLTVMVTLVGFTLE